jgi:hypothetical protein
MDYISSKINKKFGLLKRIKSCLPLDARITFVKSFILPLIDYICWGDRGNDTLMNDLQILHNKAAKIVLDQPIYSSATDALSKLKWKSLKRRRAEHRAIFAYKAINNMLSHQFSFQLNCDFHRYNTRSKNNIRKTKASRRWGHWTTVNFVSEVWNSLDDDLKGSTSITSFKNRLEKTEL